MRSPQSRGAFTLIELLVVIAILGILVALIFGAVQTARSTAQRVACANNLRQLGIALHGYYHTKNGFPPNTLILTDNYGNTATNCWATLTLPMLGQENIYRKYNFNKDWSAKPNDSGLNQIQVREFLCPAAPRSVAENQRGPNDYPAITEIGSGQLKKHGLQADPTYHGVLGYNVSRQIPDITDGLSQTLILAEDAGRNEQWAMGVDKGHVVEDGAWANPAGHIIVRGYDPATQTAPGTVAINGINDQQVYSFHPKGANSLFADGSVHFLRSTMSVAVLIALTTRAGGDSVPDGSY
jgi:prepilin-type N-terminal cleavage/methylation domain-containing protein/prepilin-type processing-associated H-X9-DG protein